jgi:hypothetical protein
VDTITGAAKKSVPSGDCTDVLALMTAAMMNALQDLPYPARETMLERAFKMIRATMVRNEEAKMARLGHA